MRSKKPNLPDLGNASASPRFTDNADTCVDEVIAALGKRIVLAMPLGLGKANHVANAFFARAQADPQLSLHIITALTLEVPRASDTLGRRFLEPIAERLYGGYPELDYATARRQGTLPHNVRVSEFFLNPGKLLSNGHAQQQYMSSNYTHAVRDLTAAGVNVIGQMIAPHPSEHHQFSLSCNPDVTMALINRLHAKGCKFFTIGQVNHRLPFMLNDAVVEDTVFDWIVHSPQTPVSDFPLFNVPKLPVSLAEYAIAIHVTSMVKDGGTLQVGIGALADAIAHTLTLRQKHNGTYNKLLDALTTVTTDSLRQRLPHERDVFTAGLYAASEMLVEGLLQLREARILTRKVYADEALQRLLNSGSAAESDTRGILQALLSSERIHSRLREEDVRFLKHFGIIKSGWHWHQGSLIGDDGVTLRCDLNDPTNFRELCDKALGKHLQKGFYCHGGFYLGSGTLYQKLRDLSAEDTAGINMCGVRFINGLYGEESLKRAQRVHARFINSALKATLMGDVVADGVEDQKIVSGVGGQYNFVAQAHELEDGRAIICLPSTRTNRGRVESNIVWQYPHTTVPRHLRDIIVTEYGAVDLRGLCDREVAIKMLAICDARFSQQLLQDAKRAGKIEQDYTLPSAVKDNLPGTLAHRFEKAEAFSELPYFPLGTEFTEQEAMLADALKILKSNKGSVRAMAQLLIAGIKASGGTRDGLHDALARLQLAETHSFTENFLQKAVIGALLQHDTRRPLS